MAKIDKEITINAPVKRIFDYVSKPSNLPQIWPSLLEITAEQLLSNGGYSFQWQYKMGGIHFEGKGEYIDFVPNQYFTAVTKGAIDSIITWTFRSRDIVPTRVTLTIDYKVPVPLLKWLAEIIIVKMNDNEADLILTNLRTRFEKTDEES